MFSDSNKCYWNCYLFYIIGLNLNGYYYSNEPLQHKLQLIFTVGFSIIIVGVDT